MYIGKVSINNDPSGNNKNKKVRVNKKLFSITINAATEENDALLEELYPYVVKCYENSEAKAYKVLEQTEAEGEFYSKVLFIMNSGDSEEIYDVSIEEANDYLTHELRVENFFGGEYRLELEENVEALLKRYDPAGNGKLYVLIGIVALVSIFGISIYMYTSSLREEQLKQNAAALHAKQEKQAVIIPLSSGETAQLKRVISLDLLEMVLSKAVEISKNEKLAGHASIRSFSATYVAQKDKVLLEGSVGYEYNYPVEGTVLISDGIYSQAQKYTIEKSRKDLAGVVKTDASVECVRLAMKVPSQTATVVERTSEFIKIKYTHVKPSALVDKLLPLVGQCPVYIDMIGMSDDTFDLVTILYSGDNQ